MEAIGALDNSLVILKFSFKLHTPILNIVLLKTTCNKRYRFGLYIESK